MNILFLSARIPYPLDTGAKIRTHYILKSLSVENKITMLTFYSDDHELDNIKYIQNDNVNVLAIKNTHINKNSYIKIITSLFSSLPITTSKYYSHEYKTTLNKLLEHDYDIIHCEHVHLAHYILQNVDVPRVLNAHNVEYKLAHQMYKYESNVIKKIVYKLQCTRMLKYEQKISSSFELILSVSENDKSDFLNLNPKGHIEAVDNGVDLNYFLYNSVKTENYIVFVGSMDWMPNIDGVNYFLESIFPIIKEQLPNVKFVVVGRNPTKNLINLSKSNSDFIVTGTVDDVRPYIEKAAVYVVPLRVGGGTRLKILEAFAMGKALVSTSLGCEGIDCIDAEHLLIRDDPQQFAYAVLDLFNDAECCEALGKNSYNLVRNKYSWDAIGLKLSTAYETLIARNPKYKSQLILMILAGMRECLISS